MGGICFVALLYVFVSFPLSLNNAIMLNIHPVVCLTFIMISHRNSEKCNLEVMGNWIRTNARCTVITAGVMNLY